MNGSIRTLLFPGTASFPHVFLKPAEVFIAWQPTLVTTILGSCVTILLFVPRMGVSALCHSLLPYQDRDSREPFRYVDSSVGCMIDALHRQNIARRHIVVKLFGGADPMGISPAGQSVGQLNIVAARRSLKAHKLTIHSSQTGGAGGYKLHIRTDTGGVFLKRLRHASWHE